MTDAPTPTVCLTVDLDALSVWQMLGATGALSVSRGEFGATVGTPRLLDSVRRFAVPTTWFIPGITAEHYPDAVLSVVDAGHEIASHGHRHLDFTRLSADEARDDIRRATEALQALTGVVPAGIRLTGSDVDGRCIEVVAEEGFAYDSSVCGGYHARWARARDVFDAEGGVQFGRPLDLVELPFDFSVTDFSHFEIHGGVGLPAAMPNPRQLEEVWCDELDDLAVRDPTGVLMIVVHPQVIGRGSRLAMLERVIEHALSNGFRFATAETLAAEFRDREAAKAGDAMPAADD
ncbi:MAG: peptidoglycan-N-acetylglucosamine deacetylase [Solirubrobacteraceae bacterium]|nr:peptidoglycan-N-acetylglucosamine deacetylase [Solirubrobacteraceae bacterium]